MTDSSRLFFTGNTLEQAVVAAASHYELDPDELAYERVERRTGFLRGRRRVVIRVDSNSPRRESSSKEEPSTETPPPEAPSSAAAGESQAEGELQDEAAEEVPVDEGAESDDGASQESAEEVQAAEAPVEEEAAEAIPAAEPAASEGDSASPRPRRATPSRRGDSEPDIADLPAAGSHAVKAVDRGVQLLAQLGDLDLTVEVYEGEDQLVVEIGGDDQHRVVHGEGRLLLAIQHLLPRVLQGITGEMTPCRVDSGGFRKKRVETLERVAHRAADEVRQGGRPKTLRSMNPADRRTVHIALEEEGDVTTESEGHGFFKRITVRSV